MRSNILHLVAATAAIVTAARAAAQQAPPSVRANDETPRAAGGQAGGFRFVDVAPSSGLTRVLWYGRPGKDHLSTG
jgi:hypothetical protein